MVSNDITCAPNFMAVYQMFQKLFGDPHTKEHTSHHKLNTCNYEKRQSFGRFLK